MSITGVMAILSPFLALIGVALGYKLQEHSGEKERNRRRASHWRALKAEIEYTGHEVAEYLRGNRKVPSHRLPSSCFATAFPTLLADDELGGEEINALLKFYCEVESVNTTVDNVRDKTSMFIDAANAHLRQIAPRLRWNDGEYYKGALAVVDRHL